VKTLGRIFSLPEAVHHHDIQRGGHVLILRAFYFASQCLTSNLQPRDAHVTVRSSMAESMEPQADLGLSSPNDMESQKSQRGM